jgi:uncharacterized protein (DUF1501 family)
MTHQLTRRHALLGLSAAVSLGRASLALAAAPTDRRFVVVMLRGALDGLSAVTPYGDPALAGLRGEIVLPGPGQPDGLLDLGGFYGLHPALAGLHGLYQAGELLPVHAVAGSWRSRSHFEAQDFMEFGADHRMTSGWLNRAAGLITPAKPGAETALAVTPALPLLLRGPTQAATWLPHSFQQPEAELYARIAALHAADLVTGPAIRAGLSERGFTEAVLAGSEVPANKFAFPALAAAAGRLLADPGGPRLAALEIGGWDTHTTQLGRLNAPLKQLDAGMIALQAGLGAAWRQTVVLVITEFGRTVRTNGTRGTDHGTGTVAFLLGGAVAGGKVKANWPGLADLFENRDLQPTLELRALAKGVLAQHLGLDAAALAQVFPDSVAEAPVRGLLRA